MRDPLGDAIALLRELQGRAKEAFQAREGEIASFIKANIAFLTTFPRAMKVDAVKVHRIFEPRVAGDGIAAKVEVSITGHEATRDRKTPEVPEAGGKYEFRGEVQVQARATFRNGRFEDVKFEQPAILVKW